MKFKKVVTFVLGTVCALSIMACGKNSRELTIVDVDIAGTEENAHVANPWTTCDTLDEACKIAGFDMKAPESLDGYKNRHISVLNQDLIEVGFSKSDDSSEIDFRKGKDSDVSGDYNEYESVEKVQIDGITVTFKGNNGTVKAAVWQTDGYGYSIFSNDDLDSDTMTEYVRQLQ